VAFTVKAAFVASGVAGRAVARRVPWIPLAGYLAGFHPSRETTSCGMWPQKPSMARRIDSSFVVCSLWRMSVVLEINRDFPTRSRCPSMRRRWTYWIGSITANSSGICTSLPENTVRYCFRTLDDASAFKRRFGNAPQGRAVVGGR
jgi:hypothetical protein